MAESTEHLAPRACACPPVLGPPLDPALNGRNLGSLRLPELGLLAPPLKAVPGVESAGLGEDAGWMRIGSVEKGDGGKTTKHPLRRHQSQSPGACTEEPRHSMEGC